jgi:hypothetical protein
LGPQYLLRYVFSCFRRSFISALRLMADAIYPAVRVIKKGRDPTMSTAVYQILKKTIVDPLMANV